MNAEFYNDNQTEIINNLICKFNNQSKSKHTDEKNVSINYLNQIIVSSFNIDLTLKDLNTLDNKNMLNDNVIDFYLQLLCQQNSNYYFALPSTYFSKMEKDGFESIDQWIDKTISFNYKIIFIPVCLQKHWRLLTIDFLTDSISYYDTINANSTKCVTAIKHIGDLIAKKNLKKTIKWKTPKQAHGIKQTNDYDCGVFVCLFARYLILNRELDFGQNDISFYRNKIKNEIKNVLIDKNVSVD